MTAPTYAELVEDLEEAAEHINYLAEIFLQLGTLFVTLNNGGPRSKHLAKLGHYVADDWANTADLNRERIMEIVQSAKEKAAVGAAASV